jgi:hypothetical protein
VERRALNLVFAIALGAALVSGVAFATRSMRAGSETRHAAPPDATAPQTERVRVQVLNATSVRGLARRATIHLRDRGFDVVEMGTAPEQRDSTLVLDRSNHPEWARRVADALGGARVESRPDTSRYLDVTVLVGRSWRPPAEPFNP